MKADPGGYLRTLRALTAEQDPNKINGLAGRLELELSILSSSGWTEEELRNLVRAEAGSRFTGSQKSVSGLPIRIRAGCTSSAMPPIEPLRCGAVKSWRLCMWGRPRRPLSGRLKMRLLSARTPGYTAERTSTPMRRAGVAWAFVTR